MTDTLIQPLFAGPLDIVGDVHGELDALRVLLDRLGYDAQGKHPGGRRLVFVGDLTDRGPDSPAVVELVRQLVDAERAQCVLGNHDLNLLLDHPKDENGWFYGLPYLADGTEVPQRAADEATRRAILDFFARLPLALERDDLRVVHACWDDEVAGAVRQASDVAGLYHEHAERIERSASGQPDLDPIDKVLRHQNDNPVKLMTSGPEQRSDTPVIRSGRIRHEQRVIWWPHYQGPFCVFGHYSIPDGQDRGNGSSFCVDYGVGKRWTERRQGRSAGFEKKLAALRYPERTVVFDESP